MPDATLFLGGSSFQQNRNRKVVEQRKRGKGTHGGSFYTHQENLEGRGGDMGNWLGGAVAGPQGISE